MTTDPRTPPTRHHPCLGPGLPRVAHGHSSPGHRKRPVRASHFPPAPQVQRQIPHSYVLPPPLRSVSLSFLSPSHLLARCIPSALHNTHINVLQRHLKLTRRPLACTLPQARQERHSSRSPAQSRGRSRCTRTYTATASSASTYWDRRAGRPCTTCRACASASRACLPATRAPSGPQTTPPSAAPSAALARRGVSGVMSAGSGSSIMTMPCESVSSSPWGPL